MAIKSVNPITTQFLVVLTTPQDNATIITELLKEMYDFEDDEVDVKMVDSNVVTVEYIVLQKPEMYPSTFLVNPLKFPNVIVSIVG